MRLSRVGRVTAVASAIQFAAVLLVLSPAAGAGEGAPDANALLTRTFIDVTPGADFEAGNFEHRRDLFLNTSTQQTLTLTGVEVQLLNPEDLGFTDLEPSNALAMQASAASTFPEYPFWGTSFWSNPGGVPPLDVPPVTWVFADFPAPTFPIVVGPGESFVLETVAHNSFRGPANPPPERIGELIIGWRFLTEVCGNGIVEDQESCDDGNVVDTDGCRNDCTIPVCGDSIVDLSLGEECDDGNLSDADGCRNDCTIPVCGDSILDAQNSETCDPPGAPAGVHGADCRADCTVCGDSVVDPTEDCDDGNTVDDDACRNDCTAPVCGDMIVDIFLSEDCDDGNMVDDDGCRNDCTAPICGDGIVDNIHEEECDDGNLVDDDGCRNDCTIPVCGDFIIDAQLSETCDPPGLPGGAIGNSCRIDCTVCGDAVVDLGEDCDDGNDLDTDSCRNDCTERGIVTRMADGANSVAADDMDFDGDYDIISASGNDNKIAWYENLDTSGDGFGDGERWVEHLISDQAMDARFVTTGFLGYSGVGLQQQERSGQERSEQGLFEVDALSSRQTNSVAGKYSFPFVFSASSLDHRITSYENPVGDGLTWIERTISSSVHGASSVFVGDFNGDFCNDVLATSATDGQVLWFSNIECDSVTWSTANVIDTNLAGARAAVPALLNPDGSLDVLAVGSDANSVVAYINSGGGTAWNRVVISNTAFGASSVEVGDLDRDGDYDAVVASAGDDSITWYENVDAGKGGGDGTTWRPNVVTTMARGASAVSVVDLDNDGDVDIVAAAADDGTVKWYENSSGNGSTWVEHPLSDASAGASGTSIHDVNGDGMPDVLASSFDDDTVAWFQNMNGLFPGDCGDGVVNAFETCDPPGTVAGGNGNLCRADCTVCGDGILDPGEDCDDGNGADAGDQCNNACMGQPVTSGRSR